MPHPSPASGGRSPTAESREPDELAPKLARVLVAVVFCGFAVLAGIHSFEGRRDVGHLLVFVLTVGIVLTLQLIHFTRYAPRRGSPAARAALVAQGLLVYAPFLLYGAAWIGMPGFFAGNLLILLAAPLSWVLFGLVLASLTVIQAVVTPRVGPVTYTAISTTLTGLVVYGLTRLGELVVEVKRNRAELTNLAVSQERLRFSQDLHDLLGYSLSAITLKSELTRRLVTSQPGRARDELVEILEIARQALSDVRVVASGYRDLSLDQESRSACSVLAAADIEVTLQAHYDPLPAQVNTVLATVLREGVTNVLGHSKAERCWITVGQELRAVHIRIVNDGVQSAPQDPPARRGTGIASLTQRVAQLGGALCAEVTPDDGLFTLWAEVPLPPVGRQRSPADGAQATA